MNGRYLLGTNVVIALFNGDAELEARFDVTLEIFLPFIALGELHFGAARSRRPEANATRIDDFAATCTVVGIDAETARRYGYRSPATCDRRINPADLMAFSEARNQDPMKAGSV